MLLKALESVKKSQEAEIWSIRFRILVTTNNLSCHNSSDSARLSSTQTCCILLPIYILYHIFGHAHAIQTIICHLVKSITEKVNTYVLLKFKLSTNSSRHIGANTILSCKQCKNQSYKGGVSSGLCCCTCASSELYVILSNEKKIVIDC